MKQNLTGIPETLLIPLAMRANETLRTNPIVKDRKAIEIVSQIEYDFEKFRSAKLSHLGVSIRTMLLDRELMKFVKKNPNCIVINLGAGLDTRKDRLKLDEVTWYELDVPQSIEMRRQFFTETDNYRFIDKSMFDYSWFDDIDDSGKPVILIAEGLFMYFEESELKGLMWKLAERFSGARMLVEVMGKFIVGKSKRHDSLKYIDNRPEFKWGIKDSRELANWHPGIIFIDEWCYFNYHKDRAGIAGYIVRLPFIRPHIAPRIVHLEFE
jgi:O-methyltransferase involved in polyketide biosynthesis